VADLEWRCRRCETELKMAPGVLFCPGCGERIELIDGIWRFDPDFEPPGFDARRRDHLEDIERSHFWFPARTRLLLTVLERAGGPRESALELGCGTGGFLAELTARYQTVVGVDAYAESLERARRRAPDAVLVQADACRTSFIEPGFDLVAALDVLEHLDPRALLDEARRLAAPRGWLLVSVPAFPVLWSALDEVAGHRCRFRRHQLAAKLAESRWELHHWTHYQALLFPLVLLARRVGSARLHREERYPRAVVSRVLGAINALEVRLLGRRRVPWGSSLLALARAA
jgi:SAM-dependent methyltransferase